MANKILNTRIQLKYDSWAEWQKVQDTFKPLKGELCVVNPGTATGSVANTPCLMKVGDGENFFKDLPWVSAPAADVHEWAKKPNPDWVDFPALPIEVIDPVDTNPEAGKFVTDVTYTDNKFTLVRSDVDWTDVKNAPDFALKTDLPTELGVMSVNKKDGTAIEVDNADAANPKVGLVIDTTNKGNVELTQSNSGLVANIEVGSIEDGNGGFVTGDAVHDAIAAAVEELTIGAHTYDVQAADSSITVNPTTEGTKTTFDVGVKIGNQGSTGSEYENALVVLAGDKPGQTAGLYVPKINFLETTNDYQFTNYGSSFSDDGISNNPETWHVPKYSITKKETAEQGYAASYEFKVAGTTQTTINIPKDMVVESGKVETKTEAGEWGDAGTYIVLKLANATEDTLYIKASELIEYVTSGSVAGDMVVVNVSDDHKVTATITDGTVTKAKLDETTVNPYIDGRVDAKIAELDVNNITGFSAGKTLATLTETDGKIAATFQDIQISGEQINTGTITKARLEEDVQNSLAKADDSFNYVTELPAEDDFVEGALTFGSSDGFEPEGKGKTLYINVKKGGISTEALADSAVTIAKIADQAVTTVKIADHAIGAHQTKACQDYTGDDAEVWVFNCGSASTLVE